MTISLAARKKRKKAAKRSAWSGGGALGYVVKRTRIQMYPTKRRAPSRARIFTPAVTPAVAQAVMPPSMLQFTWIGHTDLDSTDAGKKMGKRKMDTWFQIDGNFKVEEVPFGQNAHEGNWLMKHMANNEQALAVMEKKVHRGNGTTRTARYAYGPALLWPNKINAVHPSVHHALANAGSRTKLEPAIAYGRAPSRERRKAAVDAFGEDFDCSEDSADESEPDYDAEPNQRMPGSF